MLRIHTCKWRVFTMVVRVQIPVERPDVGVENQSCSALAGSVRVARHAGKKHAANAAIVITANADPNANGSHELTL